MKRTTFHFDRFVIVSPHDDPNKSSGSMYRVIGFFRSPDRKTDYSRVMVQKIIKCAAVPYETDDTAFPMPWPITVPMTCELLTFNKTD